MHEAGMQGAGRGGSGSGGGGRVQRLAVIGVGGRREAGGGGALVQCKPQPPHTAVLYRRFEGNWVGVTDASILQYSQ